MSFTVEELARVIKGRIYGVDPDLKFYGVSTDSRRIRPGQAFFCLKGPRFDGHNFIGEARERGMVVAVAARRVDHYPVVLVSDPLRALGDLAAQHRARFPIPLIAVAGTNGKTTTKNLIAQLLKPRYRVLSTRGNLNNLIGLPLTLLEMRSNHEIAVVELGASRKGEIARLCAISSPQVGVLTSIGPAHLQFFRSLKGVAQAKYELLQALDACGYAVLNLDDPIIRKGRSLTKAQVLGYGLGRGEGLRAEKFELTSKGSRFLLHGRWYWLPLLGEHNLYSALAALTCARIFKVEVMLQRWALARVKPEPGRTQIRKDGVTVIDDSYNANPESVRAALKTLKLFSGRRVVVLGDMLELGPSSDYWHRVLGEEVRRMADLSVFVGKEAKGYGAGYYFETPAQAQVFLRNNLLPGDVVLLKGSRAMEMEKLAEALRL